MGWTQGIKKNRALIARFLVAGIILFLPLSLKAPPAGAAGPLETVEVSPAQATLHIGQSQQFTARALDAQGQEIPGATFFWSAQAGGTITATGLFSAGTQAGVFLQAVRAQATVGGVTRSGTASVEVLPDPLAGVDIRPSPVALDATTSVQVTAVAVDRFGNPIPGIPTRLAQVGGGGTLSPAGLFTAGVEMGTFPRAIKAEATEGGWRPILGAGASFFDVFFADPSHGWVVGAGGAIWSTTDGGLNWIERGSGTSADLNSIFFATPSEGWAAGVGGAILHTTNGGQTWLPQVSGISSTLNDVFFADASSGWAVGGNGTNLHTTNGGQTCLPQDSRSSANLNSIFFATASEGWAVGAGGVILHTNSAGAAWAPQPSGTAVDLFGIFFADPSTGWAVGAGGLILATVNGGAAWEQQGERAVVDFRGASFSDGLTGWAVGLGGVILHTSNGGDSWSLQRSGTSANLEDVFFLGGARGWAVGVGGVILHTSNGGQNWATQASGTSSTLSGVFFATASEGWAVGVGGVILHTSNGGQNWATQASGTSAILRGVFFVDGNRGWAAGNGGAILHTTDGGQNWAAQASGTSSDLNDIFFATASKGWAVGAGGIILHTSNGGLSWAPQPSGTAQTLKDVHFIDEFNGWAVGNSGAILHTMDGARWQPQPPGVGEDLEAVALAAASPVYWGYAFGNASQVLRYGPHAASFADVVITAGPLDKVTISPKTVTLFMGQQAQFQAKAFDTLGNEKKVDFQWSVTQAQAGAIDQAGRFTAGATAGIFANAVRVEATQGGITRFDTATVTVLEAPLWTLSSPVVFAGDSFQVTVDLANIPAATAGLGSYHIRIGYNPSVMVVDGVLPGAAPFSQPQFVIDNQTGTVELSQAIGAAPGPKGTVRLAILQARAVGPEDSQTDLQVTEVSPTLDAQGGSIATLVLPARARISKVDISAQPRAGRAPLAVQFTDLTTDNPTTWLWTFFQDLNGNGEPDPGETVGTSTLRNPLFSFSGGDFHVRLRVTNDAGTRTITRANFIRALLLDSDATPKIGDVTVTPLVVKLTDKTGGAVEARGWTIYLDDGDGVFDEGDTVYATIPPQAGAEASINIDRGGDFHVLLEVRGPAGTFSLLKENLIRTIQAGFEVQPDKGRAPLAVQFTDLSRGKIDRWRWTFGDGSTFETTNPAQRSPAHTYDLGGDFDVALEITGPGGTATLTKVDLVRTLLLDFQASPTRGPAPLTVQFTDLSQGTITRWRWDFGDGTPVFETTNPAERSPAHTYDRGGDFHVRLEVSGPAGTFSLLREMLLRFIKADFRATLAEGVLSRAQPTFSTQLLSDLAQGVIDSYAWDVNGDGSFDTSEPNPTVTYTAAGTYTVTLRVSGPGGVDTETKEGFLTVRQAPLADFAASPDRGAAPMTTQLTELALGDEPMTFSWVVTDHATGDQVFASAEANPRLTLDKGGDFDVSLTATNAYGSDTVAQANALRTIKAGGTTNGSLQPIVTAVGQTVAFSADPSEGTIARWEWNFGDGATFETGDPAQRNPSRAYTAAGIYDVTLRVSGPAGSDDEVKTGQVQVVAAPVADFQVSPSTGIISSALDVQLTDSSSGSPDRWAWRIFKDDGDGVFEEAQDTLLTWSQGSPWGEDAAGAAAIGEQSPALRLGRGGDFHVALQAFRTVGGLELASEVLVQENAIRTLAVDFQANPTSGVISLSVQFTPLIQGTFDSANWDFQGDGYQSGFFDLVRKDALPFTYIYGSAGTFDVVVQVTGPAGSVTRVKQGLIQALQLPKANFIPDPATPTRGPAPLTVKFQDTSLGSPTEWRWDFGDGSPELVVTDPNDPNRHPTHTYTTGGTFSVRLRVSSALGSDELVRTNLVQVIQAVLATTPAATPDVPSPGQSAVVVAPGAPVTFNGSGSRGTVAVYAWDTEGTGSFNTVDVDPADGKTDDHIIHTYGLVGTYTAWLKVIGPAGVSQVSVTVIVAVQPTADFSPSEAAGQTAPGALFTTTLLDLASGNPTSYKFTISSDGQNAQWRLEDAATSTYTQVAPGTAGAFEDIPVKRPTLKFVFGGQYTIAEVVSNAAGQDGITKTNILEVLLAAFEATNTRPDPDVTAKTLFAESLDVQEGDAVNFDSTVSQGPVQKRSWDLNGDGRIDTRIDKPSRTYTSAQDFKGRLTFLVKLIIEGFRASAQVTMTFNVEAR